MLKPEIVEILENNIYRDLEMGRPGWDLPHTQAVVYYMSQIIANSLEFELDEDVLTIAAYAHDWGYAGLFDSQKKADWEAVMAAKQQHMLIGAEKTAKLLQQSEFDYLGQVRKQRIVHLVKIHDRLKEIAALDERILLEADTLGGLDIQRVKPSFDKRSGLNYLRGVKQARLPKFISKYGKNVAQELLKKAEKYYQEL